MGFSLSRTQKFALSGIAFLILATYCQLIPVGKINWDDDSNIFKNPYYLTDLWAPFWSEAYFGLYVPVTSMIWEVLFKIGKGSAMPYRFLNLSLHLLNTFLVFNILKALATRWNLKNGWALVAAVALFALHPMQVHAVAWISGGRDLLAAFFGLLCFCSFFRMNSAVGLFLSSVFYGLAVLSKPNVTVLPALLPFLCYLIDRSRLKMSLVAAGIWAGISGVSIYMTLFAQRDFLLSLSWWQRILIMGDTYSFYVQKLIFPYRLSANYDRIPEVILTTWEPYWRTGVFAIFLALAFRWAKKTDSRFAISLAWFALLLPVSGLVAFGYQRISTPADHYNYLPMIALAATILLWFNLRNFKYDGRIAISAVVVLGALSLWRVQVWKSDPAFFDDMIAYTPDSYSTGLGMSAIECEQKHNYPEGERWSFKALEKRPNDMMVLANLAYCRFNSRDNKRAVQLETYLDQIDIDEMEQKQPSAYSSFLASVGSALIEGGHHYDGFQLLCHAYRIKPTEQNNIQNMQVGSQILRNAGVNPVCEDGPLKYGKNRPKKSTDEDPTL